MPLLYFWRADNYRYDLDMGAGYHLNQANPLLHSIEIGDSLWAFTRNSAGNYVLAAEMVVKSKTMNSPGYRYGPYRVWGDIVHSRYFFIEDQPSVEPVIRNLSCRTEAPSLGQSFQGYSAVRKITESDHLLLSAFARDLPLEPRAKIMPEDELEHALYLGEQDKVEQLVIREIAGVALQRRQYLYDAVIRNRQLVEEIQQLYSGRCQICKWNPRNKYGEYLCQGHHINWLSRGGHDVLSNLVLVCPNHHTAIHRSDAPLDYQDFSFKFGTHKEPVKINFHLQAVS